jgi:hypothetical protein
MTDFTRYKIDVWDRFFEFVSAPVESLSREEVQQELRERRIDVSNAVKRVLQAVATHKARAALEAAKCQRLSTLSQLSAVVAPSVGNLRNRVQELIGSLQGEAQAAYFRKLESAATEEDLKALVDDVERLKLLSKINDSSETDS